MKSFHDYHFAMKSFHDYHFECVEPSVCVEPRVCVCVYVCTVPPIGGGQAQ